MNREEIKMIKNKGIITILDSSISDKFFRIKDLANDAISLRCGKVNETEYLSQIDVEIKQLLCDIEQLQEEKTFI